MGCCACTNNGGQGVEGKGSQEQSADSNTQDERLSACQEFFFGEPGLLDNGPQEPALQFLSVIGYPAGSGSACFRREAR